MDCSKITVGFAMTACGKPALAGTAARVILLNYTDIDKALSEENATDPNIIETIVLQAGAKGYEVDSLPNATVGEDTINVGTYNRTHQHNLTIRIFKKSEAAKKFVNGLTNARVVAVVQNNDRGDAGDTKYEIYGWDSGLELNDLTASTEMADGVAYLFTLGSGTIICSYINRIFSYCCIRQGIYLVALSPGLQYDSLDNGRVILLNYTDIDKALSEENATDPNIIETIVLQAGAKGYEVDSLPNATVGEDTINVGTYNRTHQHNLTIRIFKKSEAAKKFVNGLTNARVVAVVQNNDRGDAGDTKYEIYGWDSGLELNDLTASTEMADGVAYLFTLGSGTIAQEASLPKSFFNTDEATTDTAVEALLTATGTGA